MTLSILTNEIGRFLETNEAEVICVRGGWGVGKTHLWKTVYSEKSKLGNIALKKYSYVSLFGINSLDSLKYEIFQKAESTFDENKDVNNKKFSDGLARLPGKWRKSREVVEAIAPLLGFQDTASSLFRSAFSLVKEQIVCLDDLERSGRDMGLRDVLGMASYLKEEKRCKVIILLNDTECASEETAKDFDKLIEKVCDVVLTFHITPNEACDIALSKFEVFPEYTRECIDILGITNIRVIGKIRKSIERVHPIISDLDESVIKQSIATSVLGGWSTLIPSVAPNIELLRKYDRTLLTMNAQRDGDALPDWAKGIAEYPYVRADQFDLILLDGVQRGWSDAAQLRGAAEATQEVIRVESRDNSFVAAWEEKFHGSLAVDDEEFFIALYVGALENLRNITALNLNSAVRILRRHDKIDEANTVVDRYIEAHADKDFSFFDLSQNHFVERDEVDHYLESKFREAAEFRVHERDPMQVLKKIGAERSWSEEDILVLSGVSTEHYEEMFENLKGDEMRHSISTLIRMVRSTEPRNEGFESAVIDALRRIAAKSPLRRIKIARFGIELD